MPKTSFSQVIPSKSLQQSLRVGQAIVDCNGGKPIDKLTLAEAMKLSPTSSSFIQLVSSSQIYGLTSGSSFSKTISLSQSGKDYFYHRSIEEKQSTLVRAATHPPLVKSIYEHFNNNKLPEYGIAKNILIRNFEVKEKNTEQAWAIIKENASFSGVLHKIQGNEYINLSKVQTSEIEVSNDKISTGKEVAKLEIAPEEPVYADTAGSLVNNNGKNKRIFLSHGKNKKILEQIDTVIKFGGFESVIAVQEETTAIPVPEKIMTAMHKCDAAIINVSADELLKDTDGKETYKINENVLVEIGAAFVLYKKKVILVTDKRVSLPSNLQGLFLCRYEGNSLDWDAGMKLQKALTEFSK